ncbi:hypothetical protein Tco_0824210 [Tanacetum coccineum]|uniref:Uncharacterized protein n=1 Tax=Tanacetum coccineum TaxID=301880 RepID=A0ABQ5AL48_9ASTR
MAALESCPKHNMIAYLEKTEGNVEFHEVINFLQRSYISHALTMGWQVVSISEASIRTDLLFDEAMGEDTLPNRAIFDAYSNMIGLKITKLIRKLIPSSNTSKHILKRISKTKTSKETSLKEEEGAIYCKICNPKQGRKNAKGGWLSKIQLLKVKGGQKIMMDETKETDEVGLRKSKKNGKLKRRKNKIAEEDSSLMKLSLKKSSMIVKARIEADRILAEMLKEQEECNERFIKTSWNIEMGGLSKSEVIKERHQKKKSRMWIKMKKVTRKKKARQVTLRLYLTIAQDEDKEVDYEILDRKYPIIDWKTECFGTKPQPDEAKSIEEINLNGYFLMTNEGVVIHMLTEKKYPLKKEILVQMLNLRLESEEESTMALELIRFIKKVLADLESKEQD